MAALDAAYARVQEAEKFAEEIVNAAWLDFGRAIREARDQGTKQADIARHFDREPEHIRRLQEDADVVDGIKPPPARKTRPAPTLITKWVAGEGVPADHRLETLLTFLRVTDHAHSPKPTKPESESSDS